MECRDALAFPGDPHRVVLLRRVDAVDHDVTRAGPTRRARRLRPQAHAPAAPRRPGSVDGPHRQVAAALVGRCRGDRGRARPAAVGTHAARRYPPRPGAGDQRPASGARRSTRTPPGRRPKTPGTRRCPTSTASVAPRDARHAYAVLRGLTTQGGGMVAAATLGLPERAEAGRNYDYRYVWLRDQCYAGLAVAVTDPHPLLADAVAFTTARVLEHGDRLTPAYRADGSPLPAESTLRLPGYPGGCRGGRQPRHRPVPARFAGRDPPTAGHRRPPRPARRRRPQGGGRRHRPDRRPLADPGRRASGN